MSAVELTPPSTDSNHQEGSHAILSGSDGLVAVLSTRVGSVPGGVVRGAIDSSLSTYLNLMHKMGILRFDADQEIVTGWRKWIRWVRHSFVVGLSILYVIRNVKYGVMQFLATTAHVARMMAAITSIVHGINTLSLQYLLMFKWNEVAHSLCLLRTADSMYQNQTKAKLKQENKVAGQGLCIVSVVLTTMLLIAGIREFGKWSFSDFIGHHSYFMRATFTVWNPSQWNNKTDELFEDSFDGSSMSVSLGIFDATVNFFGWLQEQVLLDTSLLLSFGVAQHVSRLTRLIEDETASLDTKWTKYEELKKSCNEINHTFQYFLSLAHINNLFLFSYLLLRMYNRKIWFVYVLLLGAQVVKVVATYYITAATANKNKVIQDWIIATCCEAEHNEVAINGKRFPVPVLIDAARNDFIGLGQDDLFLDRKFMTMFLGAVGTVFFILVDSHDDNKKLCILSKEEL